MVSFGPANCSDPEIPGVYTRISKYLTWIEESIPRDLNNPWDAGMECLPARECPGVLSRQAAIGVTSSNVAKQVPAVF